MTTTSSPDVKNYRAPLADALAARLSYLVALVFCCTVAMVAAAIVLRWLA